MAKQIGVIVGSIRKDSWNRKLANALIKMAPASLNMSILEIKQLPFYNQDFDDKPLPEWVDFKNKIKACDGILFVTPEYNRSMPGVLKNAIDVASRPYGQSAWTKKPTAIISSSPGAIGGFGSNNHLRQCFVFLDMPCMQMPEAYIASVHQLFDEQGNLAKEDTSKFLKSFLDSYANWVEQASAKAMA